MTGKKIRNGVRGAAAAAAVAFVFISRGILAWQEKGTKRVERKRERERITK